MNINIFVKGSKNISDVVKIKLKPLDVDAINEFIETVQKDSFKFLKEIF
jgi:hypothetical protein